MTMPRRASWIAWPALAVLLLLSVLLGRPSADDTNLDDLLFDLRLNPADGATPPAFTLEGLDGTRASLSDFKGRVVLLYFWAGW